MSGERISWAYVSIIPDSLKTTDSLEPDPDIALNLADDCLQAFRDWLP